MRSSDTTVVEAKQLDAVFMRLQQLIIAEQLWQEDAVPAGSCFLSDRGVIDALAYAADRFGLHSTEVRCQCRPGFIPGVQSGAL